LKGYDWMRERGLAQKNLNPKAVLKKPKQPFGARGLTPTSQLDLGVLMWCGLLSHQYSTPYHLEKIL